MGDSPLLPDDAPEPRHLRRLRRLVTALTATLIAGVIAIVALLVIRLAPLTQAPSLPASVTVPPGETTRAVTFGVDWIAVVTVDGTGQERIRVLDRATGVARGVIEIEQAN